MKRWLTATALVVLICSATATAGTLEYLDTAMIGSGSGYVDGFGTTFGGWQTSGGNPGSYQVVGHSVPEGNSVPPGNVPRMYRNQDKGIFYDTAQYGALSSIDYSIDTRLLTATDFGGMKTGLILHNSAGLFLLNPAVLVTQVTWTTQTRLHLVAEDFVGYPMSGLDPSQHPDFSASGGLMSFGYYYQLDAFPDAPRQLSIGVDNVHVTFHYVPEPSGILMAAAALSALGLACGRGLARHAAKT